MRHSRENLERIRREDSEFLARLGYTQQLMREMGGFSNFALSFSVISILTGAVLLFGYGLRYGGPLINTIGWPSVSAFVLCVAASMAEIASMYPTAGGLYFWSFRMGGRGVAWTCAWFNLIGQITITAGIDIGAAAYTSGLISNGLGIAPNTAVPILGPMDGWTFWLAVMFALMLVQVIINLRGVRLVAWLSDFSVIWHIAGVAMIAILLTFAGRYHNGWSFLLSTAHPHSTADGVATFALGPFTVRSLMMRIPGVKALYDSNLYAFGFVLGLLQAQWTYTGYDASAHMAEETYLARMNSAWGVFLSVAVSCVAGYIALLALTASVPPGKIAETASNPYPVLYIVRSALAPVLANAIAVTIAGAMWLCGLSSLTSMARMCFAFARDGGFPGSWFAARIDPRFGTPAGAILMTSALAFVATVYSAAYTVVTSISTMALYLAYAIPIYLNFRNRRRGSGEYTTAASAPWSLGRSGPALNLVAIVWVAFITVLFSIPPNELAGLTMLGVGAMLWCYWRFWQRARFRGPALPARVASGAESVPAATGAGR